MRWNLFAFGLSVVLFTALFANSSLLADDVDWDARAKKFIEQYEKTIPPLEIEAAHAYWDANITGKEEDFAKKTELEAKLQKVMADKKTFEELKAIHEAGPNDLLLKREIDVLYLQYLTNQIDPVLAEKMIAVSNEVTRIFNVYRANLDGQEKSDNDLRKVLRESNDSKQCRAAWEAGKDVAKQIEPKLKELVKLRNEAARSLGFKNFFDMQLRTNEQDPDQMLKLFDELDELTRDSFKQAKGEVDVHLASQFKIPVAELMPWHYRDPFFQVMPEQMDDRFKEMYKKIDTVDLIKRYYQGIGLPIDDILAHSDLFEKPGKCPHAFCQDMDRKGDIRILENVVPGKQWLETSLHEFGHGIYSKNIMAGVPYAVHSEAHTLSTEGIAMLMESFVNNGEFLKAMGVQIDDPKAFQTQASREHRNYLLAFSRWTQVMFRFEKELYSNPNQDLNAKWWELVERYQGLKKPAGRNAPDYASKMHVVSAPVYYHNYQLGQLYASQLHHAIAKKVLGGADPKTAIYVKKPEVGEYLKLYVFGMGRTIDWQQLSRLSTGEELNPKAFAEDLKQ